MSLTYENPAAWRRAGHILTGILLIVAAFAARATEATGPDNSGPPPATISISSPAVSDVVKMVDAKVDPTVIKAFIQNATTTFNPSANDLIALKNHGVPDEILTAMLQRGAQVRTQIAQALQNAPVAPPTYTEPAPTAVSGEPAPASYPADYAPYSDYSYTYPAAYSYPYYGYGYSYYPYYSYYWPYYGYPYCGYGHYYCGHYGYGYYGHCYPGYGNHNGHWNGNHPSPHSSGTIAGRPTSPYAPVGTQSRPANLAMNRSPSAPVGARSANFAMSRGAAPMSGGARPASFAASVGGFHGGGAVGGHAGGGGGTHGGGGGHR